MDSTWSARELGAHARALPRRACLAFGAQGRVAASDHRALAFPPGRRAGSLADVQVLLPRGLLVDEYDMAWVRLTPFLMADLRPAVVPIKTRFTSFPETTCAPMSAGPTGVTGYGSCPL